MYGLLDSCAVPAIATVPVNHVEQCVTMARGAQPITRTVNIYLEFYNLFNKLLNI